MKATKNIKLVSTAVKSAVKNRVVKIKNVRLSTVKNT